MRTNISIIVPMYNREHTLRRCLDSILKQTYDSWECILIDDGSTDGSLAVCEEYAAGDSRFRVYHQENGGVSSARNKGLDEAVGTYINFVDSDDYLDPGYLGKLREAVEGHDMSIGGMHSVSRGKVEYYSYPSKTVLLEPGYENDMVQMDELTLLNGPCCKLFRREIIDKNGIRFLPELSFGEDLVFNYTYLLHIRSIRVVSDCLYKIVFTSGSLSDDFEKKYPLEVFLLLRETRVRFFQAKKIAGRLVQQRLDFIYCVGFWLGLRYIAFKSRGQTIIERYLQLRRVARTIDTKIMDNASNYPLRYRFLMKHPLLYLLYFELRHPIKI